MTDAQQSKEALDRLARENAELRGDVLATGVIPVSYTHLTLPTIYSV